MKYTKEQRLDIGRRIYDGEISRYEAAEEYVINEQTARLKKGYEVKGDGTVILYGNKIIK